MKLCRRKLREKSLNVYATIDQVLMLINTLVINDPENKEHMLIHKKYDYILNIDRFGAGVIIRNKYKTFDYFARKLISEDIFFTFEDLREFYSISKHIEDIGIPKFIENQLNINEGDR